MFDDDFLTIKHTPVKPYDFRDDSCNPYKQDHDNIKLALAAAAIFAGAALLKKVLDDE